MLGLAKDSNRYSNSIFYAPWTTTHVYDPLDEALVEMLYRPQTLRGAGYREAVDVLRTLTRRSWQGALPEIGRWPDFLRPIPTVRRTRGEGKGGIGSGGGGVGPEA